MTRGSESWFLAKYDRHFINGAPRGGESVDEVTGCSGCTVGGIDIEHYELDGKPVSNVCDVLVGCLPYTGAESDTLIQSRANIPNINGVEDLGLAHIRIIMDDDACDRWSHCHSVAVEGDV